MAQDNSIPLRAFQQSSPVDNFLSTYSKTQELAQNDEMHKRKIGALDQADEERKRQLVADALIAVPDGDAAAFEQVKQGLVSQGVIDPQTASQYDVSRLGQLKMMSQKWRDMKTFEMEQQQGAQRGRLTEAQIAATNRSNRPQPGGGLGGLDNKTFDNISGLRKEFQGATKDFGAVRDAYGRIKATSGAATPAGDISMIYAYMKMLDPTSVVRESEFSIAQNARPLLDRMGLSWDAVKSAWQGQKLQPEVRRDFLNQASSLYKQQLGQYENTKKQYGGLAQRFGFDPALVLTDQTGGLQPDEQAPPPGDAPPPAANGYTVRKVR